MSTNDRRGREAPQRVWVLGAETMRHSYIATKNSTRAAYHYPERATIEYVRGDLVHDLIAFWDSLDTVKPDDPRKTEEFTAEMDKRINALRRDF